MQDAEPTREHESQAPEQRERPLGRWVLAIGLVATLLRLAYVHGLRGDPFYFEPVLDAAYHLRWAEASAAGKSFVEGPYFRAPGYPEFLALCLRALAPTAEPLFWVRCLQAVLGGVGTVGLTWRMARHCFPTRPGAAHAAALLATFAWPLVAYDAELLLPALAVPLNLLALERALALRQSLNESPRGVLWRGKTKAANFCSRALASPSSLAVQCGAAFGVAALVRPNILAVLPLALLWVVWPLRGGLGRRLRPASLLALAALAVIAPVTLRNARASKAQGLGEDFVLISSQAGINLWIGNHPGSDGMSAVAPGLPADLEGLMASARVQAEGEAGARLLPSKVSRHYSAKARDVALESPRRFLRGLLWKCRLFWSAAEPSNTRPLRFFGERFAPWPTRLAFLRYGTLLALAAAGLFTLRLQEANRAALALLLLFLATYSFSVIAFFVTERFRVPIVPVLCVFGGSLLATVGQALPASARNRAQGLRAAALAAGLLLLGNATRPSALPAAFGGAPLATSEASGHWLLAQRAGEQGDLGSAEAGFRKALELRPDLWIAHRDLGELLNQSSERDVRLEAREHLQRAVELFPGVETFPALISYELVEGNGDAAQAAAQELSDRAPALSAGPYQLGRVAASRRDPAAALEHFDEALARDPRSFDAAFARARMLQDLGAAESEVRQAWKYAVDLADAGGAEAQWGWFAREAWLRLRLGAGEQDAVQKYLQGQEIDRVQALALKRRLGL